MSLEIKRPDPTKPSSWSPGYRVVILDAPGLGFHVTELDAGNDHDALILARAVAGGSAFELWEGAHLIGEYGSDGRVPARP